MRKRYLVVGVLLSMAVACQPPSPEEEATEPAPTASSTATLRASRTPLPLPTVTASPLVRPTGTRQPAATEPPWQSVGGPALGFSLSAPPGWQNLSARLPARAAGSVSRAVLWADDAAVAEALLAGAPLSAGAFVLGIVVQEEAAVAGNAETALSSLLSEQTAAVEHSPLLSTVIDDFPAAYVDVRGQPLYRDLLGLGQSETPPRLRLLLLLPDGGENVLLLQFGAAEQSWNRMEGVFRRMMQSIVVHDLQLARLLPEADGAIIVQGQLRSGEPRQARLRSGYADAWTFGASSGQRVTLRVGPADDPGGQRLDLNLTLVAPSGDTVLALDNGYAGETETVTDLALSETGRYLLLVREMEHSPGPYQAQVEIAPAAQYDSGGPIQIDEALQSRLPAGTSQRWQFQGSAGQVINIVLQPESEQLDPILELLDPTGEVVISLDEGFSGDAEVVSNLSLPISGEYVIHIYEFSRTGSSGGPYVLALSEGDEQTANFHDAGDLLFEAVRRETLRPNEVHAWFLEGLAGDEISIVATPRDQERALDLDLWLLNPSLERLVARDSHPRGQAETITHTLTTTGQHVVLVREFEGFPGDYEVQLSFAGNRLLALGPRLSYGDTVTQTVAPDAPLALPFRGEAREMITAAIRPLDNGDPVLILRDPAGNLVFSVDEKMGGEEEQLPPFILARPGDWHLIVREAHNRSSRFVLTLRRLDQDP